MNVTRKNIDDLNAVLTVEINEGDYKEKVEKALVNYRKNANIPGFRKGKVPAGLVNKQYKKPVTIDEVNKLLQDAVYNFLTEEKLDILGNPMPVEQTNIDWDHQTDFAFDFELGLTPTIDVALPKDATLTYMKVVADEATIDSYAEDMAKRYGKMSTPEKAEATDLFNGDFVELAEDGSEVAGGITKNASFLGTSISQPNVLDGLMHIQPGESMPIDAKADFKEGFNVASILGTTDAKIHASFRFMFTLKAVSRLEPHAIDQELFDKVFGEGNVNSEADFRARLKEQAEQSFVGQSDSDLFHHAYHYYLENVKFDLPESFLKKWLRTAGEKPISAEEVEEQFPQTLNSLRWQLIENRVIRDNNITVSEEELKAYAKSMIAAQVAQYGQMFPEEEIEKIADNVLKNREEAERMNDQIYNQKMVAFFKEAFTLDVKEVSAEEFYKHQAEHKH